MTCKTYPVLITHDFPFFLNAISGYDNLILLLPSHENSSCKSGCARYGIDLIISGHRHFQKVTLPGETTETVRDTQVVVVFLADLMEVIRDDKDE